MRDYTIESVVFPSLRVLAERRRSSLSDIGRRIGALYGLAAAKRLVPAGAVFAIYFEKPIDPTSVDYELCLPVTGAASALGELPEIGGENCYRIVWRGSYKGLSGVYDALNARIADENRSLSAPPREAYARGPLFGLVPIGLVTEVWYPL
ncbi:MAG: hypothetical protein WCL50_13075 [Spirochaetota bacterium]